MRVIEDVLQAEQEFEGLAMTVGSFDGIHLGHQAILDAVVAASKEMNGTAAVLTMDPHPREFFSRDHAPNLLTSTKKKFQLLENAGIDVVFVLKFNRETADIEAADFIKRILHDRCHAKAVVVGHDCRFGKGALGDFELLRDSGPEYGFGVRQIPPLFVESERVSSTLIRERILQGDLDAVERLLGRKYSLTGEVVAGRGLGATIGFPTANIKPDHSAVPAQGVYIAEVVIDGTRHPAAVNIGIAPTIRQEDLTIEAHILDFDQDIRGAEIEVVFHQRIRPEKKFPNVEALVEQIHRDVEETQRHFSS